jgi:hypothetical protein
MTRVTAIRSGALLGAIAILSGVAVAQRERERDRWVYLGEANVDGPRDHDKIVVTGAAGRFRAIQLRVERAPIEFDRVLVHFGNGTEERIPIRFIVRDGESSRVVDLPGERRVIEYVELWYSKAVPWSKKPKVRLFAIE